MCSLWFFFFKQKTAYEMRSSDWSSDVCSSDLCATLLNGWWQGAELAAGIADSEATLVIADPQRAERLACTEHGARVVTLDITRPIDEAIAPITDAGGSDATPLPALTGDALATLLFTYGQTGPPTGAYSTPRAVVQGIFNYVAHTLHTVDRTSV